MRVLTVVAHVPHPAALRTVARTVPRPVGVLALLCAVPAIVVAAGGRNGFGGALVAASLLAGAGAGYAADDPAAATLGASPTPLLVRRAARASLVIVPLMLGWGGALVVAARYGQGAVDVRSTVAELGATAAVSAAIASRASTSAGVSAGFGAGLGALLAMVTLSSLGYRWHDLPVLGGGGATHDRWWWIAAAGVVVAAWSSRDPAGSGRQLTRDDYRRRTQRSADRPKASLK